MWMLISKSFFRNKQERLHYKKAFDIVPHEWLIKSFCKITGRLNQSNLTSLWRTVYHIKGEEVIESDFIHFVKGIFQSDCLSVLFLIFSLNHLSYFYINLKNMFVKNLKTTMLHIISWLMTLNHMLTNTTKEQLNPTNSIF